MWRKSVARNQGIFKGGKKAFKTVRKVAVSSFQPPYEASIQYRESASTAPFSTAAAAAAVVPTSTMKSSDTKSDAVQNAFRVLHNERSDSAKFIMTERLDDFEVRSFIIHHTIRLEDLRIQFYILLLTLLLNKPFLKRNSLLKQNKVSMIVLKEMRTFWKKIEKLRRMLFGKPLMSLMISVMTSLELLVVMNFQMMSQIIS